MRMASHGAWLFLLFAVLHPSGTARFPKQKPPQRVSGILGGSAVLSAAIVTQSPPASHVEWKFQGETGGLAHLIAESGSGDMERPNPRDRFGQRLEVLNETALRIRALEPEDGGVYTVRVRLANAKVEERSFRLAVHEPLPAPRIVPQLVSGTPDDCNVTLRCEVSGRSDAAVFWKRGGASTPLEDASARHRLSENGRTLHFSWRVHTSNSSFSCVARSPLEQKEASFDLRGVCVEEGANTCLFWLKVAMASGLAALVTTVIAVHHSPWRSTVSAADVGSKKAGSSSLLSRHV